MSINTLKIPNAYLASGGAFSSLTTVYRVQIKRYTFMLMVKMEYITNVRFKA